MKSKILNVIFLFVLFGLVLTSCDAGKTTKYTVTFDSNGGTLVESQEVEKNALATKPADPEKDGYVFVGWFSDSQLSEAYDFDTKVSKAITLYAKWESSASSFTVRFVTGTDDVIDDQIVARGAKVTAPVNPTKNLFVFSGWYLDEALTTKFDLNSTVTKDLLLYAGFKQVYVLGITRSSTYSKYLQNIKEQGNKEIEFLNRGNKLLVGTDNAWKTSPIIDLGVLNSDNEFDDIELAWQYELELQELVDGTYSVVNYTEFVESFDEVTGSIDFALTAVDKEFKVVVTPKGLTNKQKANLSTYQVSYEVKVVEGFNAYTDIDFAYVEARPADDDTSSGSIQFYAKTYWDEFKTQHGLDVEYVPSRVILQNDINITKDSLPSVFFYDDTLLSKTDSDYDRTIGSLIDWSYLYKRILGEGESFELYGNYFNIDSSLIREIQRESNKITPVGGCISHSALLTIHGEGTFTIDSLSTSGNAPRTEDSVKAGGVIFLKQRGSNLVVENLICFDYFIGVMVEKKVNEALVDSCKFYNGYNSFLYNWGCENFTVKDSEFSSCGGPVTIQDCIDYGTEDEKAGSATYINCKFNVYVTGQEGWFVSFNATALVGQIKALDTVLNAYGKSFLKTDADGNTYFNLIVVNKSSEAQGITSSPINGSNRFDDLEAIDFGESNPYFAQLLQAASSQGAPVFKGSNASDLTGYAYFDGSGLKDITGQLITDPTNPLFSSQYLGLYYGGMLIVFELFDAGQTYTK